MLSRRLKRFSPPQLIALSFAVTIALGSALLALPFAHRSGQSPGLLQNLFTATSAVCITGLSVVDIGKTYNTFGQVLILLLVQVGGLGIITFGTLFAFFAGRRINFSERIRLAQQLNALDVGGVITLLRKIVLYTLTIEAAGTLLLALRLVPREGLGQGLYFALFHSVSAFNSAGFSLYPDSLMSFASDPIVSLTVTLLVLLGGLGFLVQVNVVGALRRGRAQRLSVYSRLVLSLTLALLLIGAVGVAALEWSNPRTLGALPLHGKLLASLLGSATTRSAGFNSLDFSLARPATLLLTLGLMFIGANPGSTGGGIKTTTFFVLLGSAWSLVRGRGELVVFGRTIDRDTVMRALTVALLSVVLVSVMFFGLLLTNPRLPFLNLLFEAVSAFGTVGLSLNTTPHVNGAGQVILILLMYLGRIGPLTFAVAFGLRAGREVVRYPAERDILIG